MGYAVICWRCQLHDQLTDLLAGPGGRIPVPLRPFVEALLGLPQPRIGYVWIRRNAAVQTTLRRLAASEVALDHSTFDQLPGRTTDYLRGLLFEHGCLPGRDRYLAAFENWLPTKLDQIADPGARRHIDAFARWHLLRQLRDRAKREPIPTGAFLNAKQSTTVPSTSSTGWPAAADNWRPSPRTTWTPGTPADQAPDPTPRDSSAGDATST